MGTLLGDTGPFLPILRSRQVDFLRLRGETTVIEEVTLSSRHQLEPPHPEIENHRGCRVKRNFQGDRMTNSLCVVQCWVIDCCCRRIVVNNCSG